MPNMKANSAWARDGLMSTHKNHTVTPGGKLNKTKIAGERLPGPMETGKVHTKHHSNLPERAIEWDPRCSVCLGDLN